MNNEPVAWISEYTLKNCLQGNFTDEVRATTKETTNCTIPLYTHPVKELTDDVAKYHYNKGHEDGRKLEVVKKITDEEIHQAIRRGFSREGFLSDGIFLEIKELLRNTQGVNSEQVPDFFFMENDLMGKR